MCTRIHSFLDLAFNPLSTEYNAKKYFLENLTLQEKIKVVALTALAALFTCGLATLATFRFMVASIEANRIKSGPATIPLNQFIDTIFSNSSIEYTKRELYSKNDVQALFTSLFGKAATNSAMCMYKLLSQNQISSIAVHALLLGIVANLTKNDLEHIQMNCSLPPLQAMVNTISEKAVDDSRRKVELLKKLRQIPRLPNHPIVSKEMHLLDCYNQADKDREFLISCSWLENGNIAPDVKTHELKKFSFSEYLASVMIYGFEARGNHAAFQEGTLIPVSIYNKDAEKEQTILMQAHRLITRSGLHSVVLIPAFRNDFDKNEPLPVQILFRGTMSADAWNRNFNFTEKQQYYGWEGPGGASFNRNHKLILKNLKEILTLIPNDQAIKMEIFGHSLGASDAERMCAFLTDAIASKQSIDKPESQKNSKTRKAEIHEKKIKEVNLFCYNAPGIEDFLNDRFIRNIEKLKKIKFQLRYFKVAHDPIQTAANQLLGYYPPCKDPIDNLFVSVFRLAKPSEFFGVKQVKAHMERFLCNYTHVKKKIPNKAWIASVKTNNPEDAAVLQQGPTGRELPSPGKFNERSVIKALNNRGEWSKSLRQALKIPKVKHIKAKALSYVYR